MHAAIKHCTDCWYQSHECTCDHPDDLPQWVATADTPAPDHVVVIFRAGSHGAHELGTVVDDIGVTKGGDVVEGVTHWKRTAYRV